MTVNKIIALHHTDSKIVFNCSAYKKNICKMFSVPTCIKATSINVYVFFLEMLQIVKYTSRTEKNE